jgi:hypothetical protein
MSEGIIRSIKRSSVSVTDLYHVEPVGVYETARAIVDSPFYPVYFFSKGESIFLSTSVHKLIEYRGSLSLNPRFFCLTDYRKSYSTIDAGIHRIKFSKTSTREVGNRGDLGRIAARCIQHTVRQVEEKYPHHHHLLMLGGMDSKIILTATRNAKWVVLSGEPDAGENGKWIERNNLEVSRYLPIDFNFDPNSVKAEILATDAEIGLNHLRFFPELRKLIDELKGQVVIWYGFMGETLFRPHPVGNSPDYFLNHSYTSTLSWNLVMKCAKNLLDVPVVCPYASAEFIQDYFLKFDPSVFSSKKGKNDWTECDIRPLIARELSGGGEIWFPEHVSFPRVDRPCPNAVEIYVSELRSQGVRVYRRPIARGVNFLFQKTKVFINQNSVKKRTPLSRVLFPLRRWVAKYVPALKPHRYCIKDEFLSD